MKAAAELVGARKFIERLPGGYDYNVMERGATFVGWSKAANLHLKSNGFITPKLLFWMKPTSSVDTDTEEMIQNAMKKNDAKAQDKYCNSTPIIYHTGSR